MKNKKHYSILVVLTQ